MAKYSSLLVRQAVKKYMALAVAPCRQSVGKREPGPRGGISLDSLQRILGYSTGRMFKWYILRGMSGCTGICELRVEDLVVEILDLGVLRNQPKSREHGLLCYPFRKQTS